MKVDPRALGLSPHDLTALGYSTTTRPTERVGRPDDPSSDGHGTGPAPGDSAVRYAGERAGRWRWLGTLVVVGVLLWGLSPRRGMPRPTAANAPELSFSSGRALALLSELGRSPRPPGSPEHARVRGMIRQRLAEVGFTNGEPYVAPVALSGGRADVVDATTVRNVVARLEGEASTGAVLVVAPYDSRPLTSAASSGAAGVATLLEVGRALTSGRQLRNDVIVLFAGAETLGGLGTRAFAEQHPWMSEVVYAVSVAPGGGRSPAWLVPFGEVADPLHARRATTSLSSVVQPGLVGGDVTRVLTQAGVDGLTLYSFDDSGRSGTVLDVVDVVDERALADQGTRLLRLLRREGMRDHRRPRGWEVDPQVVTSAGWMGGVHHPWSWIVAVSGLLFSGWGVLVFILRRGGVRPARLRAGLLLGGASVAAGAAIAGICLDLLATSHPELGRVPGGVFSSRLHASAVTAVVAAAVTALYGLARLRFGLVELYVGALAVPLAAIGWLTVSAPAGAGVVQVVALVALLQGGALVALRRPGLRRFVPLTAVVFSVGILAVVLPGLEWVTPAMWIRSPEIWGAILASAGLLLLPLLEGSLTPRRLAAPLTMIAVAGMVTLVADPALVGDAGRPQLTSLSLLAETADSASWLARGGDPSLSVSFAGMAELNEPVTLPRAPRRLPGSWLTVPGPGESWARSWAVPGETSARGTEGLLLPEQDKWVVAGAGPVAEVSPARIDVVRRSFDGRFHTVALEIRSGLSGLVTGVRLPDGLPGSFRSVQGQPLGPAESVRALRWWGHTRGDPLRLEVRVSAGHDVIELDVIEQHLSPQKIVGPDFFVRDARLLPDVRTGSDRMILRTRVPIPLAREVSPLQADRGLPAHLP